MKDEQMQKGQLMEKFYKPWSSVSVPEDAQREGKHATRTLERLKEIISHHLRPMDSGMWKWVFGSEEVILIVRRWDDLGPDINETGLVKLTLRQIEGMIHPEDLQSVREFLIAHMESKSKDGIEVDFRVRGKSGDWRWVRVETEVIRWDNEGRPAQAVGCFADVTEVWAILETFAVGEGSEEVERIPIKFDVAALRLR